MMERWLQFACLLRAQQRNHVPVLRPRARVPVPDPRGGRGGQRWHHRADEQRLANRGVAAQRHVVRERRRAAIRRPRGARPCARVGAAPLAVTVVTRAHYAASDFLTS